MGRSYHMHNDDEDRAPMPERGQVSRPMPSVIDTSLLRAVRPALPAPEEEPTPPHHLSRRELLAWGGAALAAVAGLGIISQTKAAKSALTVITHQGGPLATPVPTATAPTRATTLPFTYFHACFEVNTPAEVDVVAALGINYTITYGDWSWASADPTTPMGKALLRHNMQTFVNVEYPFLQCPGGYGYVSQLDKIRDLVVRFKDSPLTAGYWIKDDDCGDEGVAILGLYNLIRSIDTNPAHLIMPGFGDAGSVNRNYAYGSADLLGFYPYPAYSRGPALEVPDMLRVVRDRTPAGATPPPFIGIYQDFASPPYRPILPVSNVIEQVKAYMANGAVGVAGFGWDEAPPETYVASNNATLAAAVPAVTQWLTQNGYGTAQR